MSDTAGIGDGQRELRHGNVYAHSAEDEGEKLLVTQTEDTIS